MAREKSVFPSSEVFHLFAHRIGRDIRNASGNVFTQGDGLYSYGTHFCIAARLSDAKRGELLLFNESSYSATTNKHRSQAWRAFTSQMRADSLSVRRMDREIFTKAGQRVAAQDCAEYAAETLAKAETARKYGEAYAETARRYIETARQLFAFCGEGERAKTLPAIDPKGARAEWRVARVAIIGAKAREQARERLARANESFAKAQSWHESFNATREGERPYISARNVGLQYADARNGASFAAERYYNAGMKPAPACARIKAACEKAIRELQPFADAEREAEESETVRREYARTLRAYAKYSRPLPSIELLPNGQIVRRGSPESRTLPNAALPSRLRQLSRNCDYIERDEGDFMAWPARAKHSPDGGALFHRVRRIIWADKLRRAFADAGDAMAERKANPNGNRYGYGLPDSARLRRCIAQCEQYGVKVSPDEWARARAIIADIEAAKREAEQAAIAEQAARVEAWRRGERVTLSHNLPTMARIVGDAVETSRGARVPLSHACRFVRIAERIAARGGKEWRDGEGPIVGHYRANGIGPDMSAVIGCHQFGADESARIVAIIKATAEWAAMMAGGEAAEA